MVLYNSKYLTYFSRHVYYLVGRGYLFAVYSKGHQTGGQVNQTADFQVHVAATGGVSSIGDVTTPHHVAVTPLYAAQTSHSVCFWWYTTVKNTVQQVSAPHLS